MTILLDENFPLGLLRHLRAEGLVVDHIITLGWRGAKLLQAPREQTLFELTDDGVLVPWRDMPTATGS